MTSEASDLPDWKDKIPGRLAAQVDNSSSQSFSPLLALPQLGEGITGLRSARIQKRSSSRTGSKFSGRAERAWEKSCPVVNRVPSLRTRAPSLAPQATPWRWWWMKKYRDHRVRKQEGEGTWEAGLVRRNGYRSQEGVFE